MFIFIEEEYDSETCSFSVLRIIIAYKALLLYKVSFQKNRNGIQCHWIVILIKKISYHEVMNELTALSAD